MTENKHYIQSKPSLYYLLTCDRELWEWYQHPDPLAPEYSEKYERLLIEHLRKLNENIKFEEEPVIYIFARADQSINLRSFGRKRGNYIRIGKFPDITNSDVKKAFLKGYDREEILVSLTTRKINDSKCCFLSACIPYKGTYLELGRNIKGYSGLKLERILNREDPELEQLKKEDYEYLSDWEIPVIKHHLKLLDKKLAGPLTKDI